MDIKENKKKREKKYKWGEGKVKWVERKRRGGRGRRREEEEEGEERVITRRGSRLVGWSA